MSRVSRQQTAFTLVEVLVGLALSGLLVMGLHGLMVGAQRTSRTLQDRSKAERAADALPEWLREDLRNQSAGGDITLRDGVLSLTTLNSVTSQRLAARHAVNVRYRLMSGRDGRSSLVRSEWELDADPPTEGIVVSTDLASLHWQAHDGQRWVDTWPLPTPRPLRAVRLTAKSAVGDVNEWVIPIGPLQWKRHDE